MVRNSKLSKNSQVKVCLFLRIISSREMFLGDKPFESLESAEGYAHDAFSSANYLVLECLNGNNNINNDSSNKDQGCQMAIARFLYCMHLALLA